MTEAEQKLLNALLNLQQAFTGFLEQEGSAVTEGGHWSAFHFNAQGDKKEVFNIFGGQPNADISFRKYEDCWRL